MPGGVWIRAAIAFAAAFLAASSAFADKRIALVIGNSAYTALPAIPNPKNEALKIGEALKGLGYQATTAVDVDKKTMKEVIERFSASAGDADVALFYFSGHGYQIGSENFLISTDAVLAGESDLIDSIRLTDVVRGARAKKARIFLLDCNRDNPFARDSGDRRMPSTGFAEPAPGNDIFIGYSTSTGKVAEDGGGLLSPFAVAFLKRVEENEDLAAMFKKITLDVNRATDGRQTPAFHDSLATAIFLRAAP
jgi:uncharacterized caspase-like protein